MKAIYLGDITRLSLDFGLPSGLAKIWGNLIMRLNDDTAGTGNFGLT